MKLRHKKPLNPYKGQTNNDKNEFNDDDFRQQGSPLKKNGNGTTDQIYKYARLLTKFIKTINQDYRQYEAQVGGPHPHPLPDRPQPMEIQDFNLQQEMALLKKQQIKQQKQQTKLDPKIQIAQDRRDHKAPSKKKQTIQSTSNPKQNRMFGLEQSSIGQIGQNRLPTPAKSQLEVKDTGLAKGKSTKPEVAKPNSKPSFGNVTPSPNPPLPTSNPNAGNMFGMNLNPQINLNGYFPMPAGMPPLFNQNQLLGNLNMMGVNGLGSSQINQLLMNYNNNRSYLYGGFPVGMNMGMMGGGVPNNSSFMYPEFRQPQTQKPPPNLFKEQVTSLETNNNTSEKSIKTIYPLKRSAYHVAISYKIYLDKLKREGKSFDNLEEIDPTRQARRIKTSQQSSKQQSLGKKKK